MVLVYDLILTVVFNGCKQEVNCFHSSPPPSNVVHVGQWPVIGQQYNSSSLYEGQEINRHHRVSRKGGSFQVENL